MEISASPEAMSTGVEPTTDDPGTEPTSSGTNSVPSMHAGAVSSSTSTVDSGSPVSRPTTARPPFTAAPPGPASACRDVAGRWRSRRRGAPDRAVGVAVRTRHHEPVGVAGVDVEGDLSRVREAAGRSGAAVDRAVVDEVDVLGHRPFGVADDRVQRDRDLEERVEALVVPVEADLARLVGLGRELPLARGDDVLFEVVLELGRPLGAVRQRRRVVAQSVGARLRRRVRRTRARSGGTALVDAFHSTIEANTPRTPTHYGREYVAADCSSVFPLRRRLWMRSDSRGAHRSERSSTTRPSPVGFASSASVVSRDRAARRRGATRRGDGRGPVGERRPGPSSASMPGGLGVCPRAGPRVHRSVERRAARAADRPPRSVRAPWSVGRVVRRGTPRRRAGTPA